MVNKSIPYQSFCWVIEDYKNATNWSTIYNSSDVTFTPMSELPEEFRTQFSQETKDLYGWS